MSRQGAYQPPPGWAPAGFLRYEHPSGAVVDRAKNPIDGLLEWRARRPDVSDHFFTGQDLDDAFALASVEAP